MINSRSGKLALAAEDWNQAIRLDPNDFDSCYRRGSLFFKNKAYVMALEDLDEAIRRAPDDPENHHAYLMRAWLRATCPDRTLRDAKIAVESANKACDLTGWKKPSCLITVGEVHARLGDFDAALKAVDKAIALLDPGHPQMQACRKLQAAFRERKIP